MSIYFALLQFISIAFATRVTIKSRLHMRNKHPKFHARLFSRASLFNHLYDKTPKFATFRFNENSMPSSPESGDGYTLMKGWLQFVVLNPSNPRKFTNFYFNPSYEEQEKRHYDKSEEDEYGKIDIESNTDFFGVLTVDSVYIVTARRNDLMKTTSTIPIKSLYPETRDSGRFLGGAEDVGNFKEGYCMKLRQRSDGTVEWILCFKTPELKTQWLSKIANLLLNKARGSSSNNPFDVPMSQEIELKGPFANVGGGSGEKKKLYHDKKGKDEESNFDPEAPVEGYWEIIQDWSTCTKGCGGGTQTLQRYCHEPKNGGKPCIGRPIEEKPCNTQPCPPELGGEKGEKGDNIEEEEAPLKVKMMRVTTRPDRYETCIIKEGDMNVVLEEFTQLRRKPRLPAHIILNNRTFSVFTGEHYDSIAFSASLGDIMINENYDDDPVSCFVVKNVKARSRIVLCAFTEAKKGPETIKKEWIDAIMFFVSKCYVGLSFAPDHEEDPVLDMKKKALEEEALEQNAAGGASVDHNAANKMAKSMQELQALALDAIAKEVKYEQMKENEERIKLSDQEKELNRKLEQLSEQNDCLNRDLKKKNTKAESDIREKTIDFNFDELKDSIKAMIMKKRSEQTMRIQVMEKMAGKRRRGLMNKISDLQTRMAKSMIEAERAGNATLCDPALNTPETMKSYCNKNFNDDPGMNKDCKDPDVFCYMCCEIEVGIYFIAKRESCMEKCVVTKKKTKGNWIYVPESNKVK